MPGFVMVKPAQLQQSRISCGKTHCNGSVPVPTLTWNRSSRFKPSMTLKFMTHHMGIFTCLPSGHIEALHSDITIVQSITHTDRDQPSAQTKYIQVMGHSGKNMTSTKVGYGESEMFPPLQSIGQRLSSLGVWRVPSGPLEINPVNWSTSSSSNPPPEPLLGTPETPPISPPTNRFQLLMELWQTDVTGIMHVCTLSPISYDN